jgi:hypothetical protein
VAGCDRSEHFKFRVSGLRFLFAMSCDESRLCNGYETRECYLELFLCVPSAINDRVQFQDNIYIYDSRCLYVWPKGEAAQALNKSCRRVYSKVSGLAAWSENCKWYSSLPLGAVVLLFCESV